jgi:hypothetical protein
MTLEEQYVKESLTSPNRIVPIIAVVQATGDPFLYEMLLDTRDPNESVAKMRAVTEREGFICWLNSSEGKAWFDANKESLDQEWVQRYAQKFFSEEHQ